MREAESRNQPDPQQSKSILLRKRLIGYGHQFAGALRFRGEKITLEPITDETDEYRSKLGKANMLKQIFPYKIKGSPEAIEVFHKALGEIDKQLNQVNKHKNVKKAVAAGMLAVVAWQIVEKIKEHREREIPPPDYEG